MAFRRASSGARCPSANGVGLADVEDHARRAAHRVPGGRIVLAKIVRREPIGSARGHLQVLRVARLVVEKIGRRAEGRGRAPPGAVVVGPQAVGDSAVLADVIVEDQFGEGLDRVQVAVFLGLVGRPGGGGKYGHRHGAGVGHPPVARGRARRSAIVQIIRALGGHFLLQHDDSIRPVFAGVEILPFARDVVGHGQGPDRVGVFEERHVVGFWLDDRSIRFLIRSDLLVEFVAGHVAEIQKDIPKLGRRSRRTRFLFRRCETAARARSRNPEQ